MTIYTVYLDDSEVILKLKKAGWLKPYEVWITKNDDMARLHKSFWRLKTATVYLTDMTKIYYKAWEK